MNAHTRLTRLYLIRHGETEWSLSRQHTGRTEISLTARGEEEARGLEERLRGISFEHVLTSPRQRARRTCELAALLPKAEIEPDLQEWDYGDYEGRRTVDIRKGQPGWNLFRDGCPQGETPSAVSARADRLLTRLRKLDGNIALFSHGHFGSVLAARWIELPLVQAEHFLLFPASISILSSDDHHPEVPVIAQWNVVPLEIAKSMTMKQRAIQRWENEGGEIPIEPRTEGTSAGPSAPVPER